MTAVLVLLLAAPLQPTFDGKDLRRPQIAVALTPVAQGFQNPTDVQFPPGQSALAVVLEKEGGVRWAMVHGGETGTIARLEVVTMVEQGLLGLAFHPRFAQNGKLYLNATVESRGRDVSRVTEWTVPPGSDLRRAKLAGERLILEVAQPYPNHNAGQLAFGPDGFLYVGWGDGGWMGDPHGHGQNTRTMLGSMLRIDVDRRDAGKAYGVPPDNPFVVRAGFLPELWAYGLRNPWRYSFDPAGRLIVADVGQDKWEEISIVERGKNYGWAIREGTHCYPEKTVCPSAGLEPPFYEYGHDEGQSITGGYVYTGARIPRLAGKFVFADFVTGRIWALELERKGSFPVPYALGKWPIAPSTFGRDAQGELYVADFASGTLYRIDPIEKTE